MRRHAFIQLCLYLTVATVAVAVVWRLATSPPGPIGGDVFGLVSPVFLGVMAKNATRFGKVAVILALAGLVIGVSMLAMVITSPAPPG